MKVAIIAALDHEVEFIKQKLDNVHIHDHGFHQIIEGQMYHHHIFLSTCGIGKVNAAITTQKIISEYQPELIINTGTAGGLNDELNPLDTIIAQKLSYHDTGEEMDSILTHYIPFTDEFYADERYVKVLSEMDQEARAGIILTGDVFVNSKAKKDAILAYKKGDCVEMEGAAVAHTAFINKIPFLVIRTISDSANDDADNAYENFKIEAAKKTCALIIRFLHYIKE